MSEINGNGNGAGPDQQTAAERYRELAKAHPDKVVDLTAPSGFVFKFKKPSKYALLFSTQRLPQWAASKAAEAWAENNDDPENSLTAFKTTSFDQQLEIAQTAFHVRDRVLELSIDPKLVVGPAEHANELSTDDIADDDLTFLCEWVVTGGQAGTLPATFPDRSGANTVVGINRKKRRAARKQAGRA